MENTIEEYRKKIRKLAKELREWQEKLRNSGSTYPMTETVVDREALILERVYSDLGRLKSSDISYWDVIL